MFGVKTLRTTCWLWICVNFSDNDSDKVIRDWKGMQKNQLFLTEKHNRQLKTPRRRVGKLTCKSSESSEFWFRRRCCAPGSEADSVLATIVFSSSSSGTTSGTVGGAGFWFWFWFCVVTSGVTDATWPFIFVGGGGGATSSNDARSWRELIRPTPSRRRFRCSGKVSNRFLNGLL